MTKKAMFVQKKEGIEVGHPLIDNISVSVTIDMTVNREYPGDVQLESITARPDGSTITVQRINSWNWQASYGRRNLIVIGPESADGRDGAQSLLELKVADIEKMRYVGPKSKENPNEINDLYLAGILFDMNLGKLLVASVPSGTEEYKLQSKFLEKLARIHNAGFLREDAGLKNEVNHSISVLNFRGSVLTEGTPDFFEYMQRILNGDSSNAGLRFRAVSLDNPTYVVAHISQIVDSHIRKPSALFEEGTYRVLLRLGSGTRSQMEKNMLSGHFDPTINMGDVPLKYNGKSNRGYNGAIRTARLQPAKLSSMPK